MNWRSIRYLSDDDRGKPLLIDLRNLANRYHDYEVGYYYNKTINCCSCALLIDRLPADVRFVRIDEIMC